MNRFELRSPRNLCLAAFDCILDAMAALRGRPNGTAVYRTADNCLMAQRKSASRGRLLTAFERPAGTATH